MATATRDPVINGDAISPGCTVISNTPEEFDQASVRRANRIVTTSVDEVMTHIPPMQAIYDLIKSGELPSPHGGLVEITDVIGGREPGRTSDDEIIICFNAGTGIHDVAAGKYVYERARELGVGTELPV
jgi:ornithine cyclodeaminase/alanine dehydrogenase-like protein (mu-crystallin family)